MRYYVVELTYSCHLRFNDAEEAAMFMADAAKHVTFDRDHESFELRIVDEPEEPSEDFEIVPEEIQEADE